MSSEESDRPFSDRLNQRIKSLSESMGLGSDFLHDLNDEDDDWAFVVKLHAVLEAAVNELLKAKLATGIGFDADQTASTTLAN